MPLVFTLPKGAASIAALHFNKMLKGDLADWCKEHGIDEYSLDNALPFKLTLTFKHEQHYSLFALSWQPRNRYMMNYVYRV